MKLFLFIFLICTAPVFAGVNAVNGLGAYVLDWAAKNLEIYRYLKKQGEKSPQNKGL